MKWLKDSRGRDREFTTKPGNTCTCTIRFPLGLNNQHCINIEIMIIIIIND